MDKPIDLYNYPVWPVLERLLQDKTTKQNIIFATDAYLEMGDGFSERDQIQYDWLSKGLMNGKTQSRTEKTLELQQARTRKKAEVFTPSWIVNKMNNYCDADWFGRENVFNRENAQTWVTNPAPIEFDGKKGWQKYVDSRRLEITCGEAPFIVSRYDAATGTPIPNAERIGILDRKMRVVNENAESDEQWLKWTQRAFEACYGYEYQGDNLLIARANLLAAFAEHYRARFNRKAEDKLLQKFANIICWNFWQMNGITGTLPFFTTEKPKTGQIAMDEVQEEQAKTDTGNAPVCRIMDWRSDRSVSYDTIRRGNKGMKFDYVIGNPPYQDETLGDNKGFAPPVYDKFLDSAYQIADAVEMIHPARFLFNAGSTPKAWNQKMLSDSHLKVMFSEQDSSKVFPHTDIKGGIAITYHDYRKEYGAIGVFTAFPELNEIRRKAAPNSIDDSLTSIIYLQNRFNLETLYTDYPEMQNIIGSDGKDKRFRNNSFDKIALFTDNPTQESDVKVLGISKNKRVWRYLPVKYFDDEHENFKFWKVLVPRANGSGALGEVLSTPLIGSPLIGYTQSFIGIGAFINEEEACAAMKYVKSKFARCMLGILKITQDNNRETWAYVPLQDFTPSSDIDWSNSVHDIDLQLYKKYGLDKNEIDFIETHVKEME